MPEAVQHKEYLLIADPKILAIPIVENQEPMLNLINQSEIAYGSSPEIPNNIDYTKMRKTVYEKIKEAQARLPNGLRLCIYEGYRSLSLQKMLFDDRFEKISKLYPSWTKKQIFDETIKLVSPVINEDGSTNIPPHSTGGAIDIYLTKNNLPVDMGIHPKDWTEDTDGKFSETLSPHLSTEAKKNRKIMCDVLSAVGFVNYPTEYWHWSYGDRYWAYYKNEPRAIYGIIER